MKYDVLTYLPGYNLLFECVVCGKCFSKSFVLISHIEKLHLDNCVFKVKVESSAPLRGASF